MSPSWKCPSVPSPKLENHSKLAQTSSEDQTKCDVFDMTMVFYSYRNKTHFTSSIVGTELSFFLKLHLISVKQNALTPLTS